MPSYYSPYYQQNYQQSMYQSSSNSQQIQNGGFVSVRNETEARNYPIAYGNSVTFKDENAPYIYTKTMGFSQLDNPVFEKYRLVKEQPVEASKTGQNDELDIQSIFLSIDKINEQIEALWAEIDALKDSSAKEKTTTKNGSGKRDKSGDD